MQNNQKGFGVVEIVVALVIVGLVGFAGWFIWQSGQEDRSPDTANARAEHRNGQHGDPQETPSRQTTYENKELGFKFAYPSSWGQVGDLSTTPADGGKKYFTLDIMKGDKLAATITSYPKESCPRGDSIATMHSQGWYEKGGSYYTMWCQNSPQHNGVEYKIGFESGTVKKIDNQRLAVYAANVSDDPTRVTPAGVGLFNLANNTDYTGLSISRLFTPQPADKAALQQEFEKVLATFVEL